MMNQSAAKISLLSSCSNCKYHQSKKSINLCFSEVSINQETYTLQDYIVIKAIEGKQSIEIVKFICIYLSNDQTVCTVLRKFVLAKEERILFKKYGWDYDSHNEVVEDLSSDYFVELNSVANSILNKCSLAFLTEDEDPTSFITNLDQENLFVCRFSMKDQCLFPKLSAGQTILSENSHNSPLCTIRSKKSRDKMSIEITPSTYIKNIKENDREPDSFSPLQRNAVKRNLNKSFGNSPQDRNKSILDYSIVAISDDETNDSPVNYSIVNVSDDENENPLVIRLKMSGNQNDLNCSNSGTLPWKARKSTRNIARKSYADYVSPHKSTPTKRLRNSSIDEEFIPKSNKVARETTQRTPSRNLRSEVLSKRNIVTPQRYADAVTSCERSRRDTPARRHLRLIHTEESKTPRSLRGCRRSKSSYNEEDKGIHKLPGFNFDGSITRKLKVELSRLHPETERVIRETPNCEVEVIESDEDKTKMLKDSIMPRTPKSKRKPSESINTDSDSDTPPSTPKTRRGASVSKNNIKATPKRITAKKTPKQSMQNRAKLIREGKLTPSLQARSKQVDGISTPLMMARSQLHVSYVPDSLSCREKEYCDVFNFVKGKLLDRCGGCMYISGVPGTGKTATATSVIKNLLENDNVPEFTFVNVNGMRLTEPRQAYVEILKQLQGKSLPWEQAQSMLDDLFNKSKKLKPVVMLIDELDVLCTKRQDVVYNLLDWPTKAKNQLVVITIANTMDLPERLLMSRVTSRLGLTRLTFNAYTHKQLQEIVTRRLCGTDSFNPDAVQFVARKVASVSGDARRALDICRRAVEIAESEGKGQLVNMNHVNEALNAMITQPKIRAIKHCSRLEQLIMQSIVAEVERTGVEETTFADAFKMFETCAAIEGFKMVSTTVALSAVARLGACRLILTDQKCSDIYQRIILNVSVDDVYYALKH